MRDRMQAELAEMVSARNRRLQLEVEVIEADDVARTVLGAAERHDVDLLCLGTHQFGRVATALPGSIAREVARSSRRPVLLVPPSARKTVAPSA